MAARGPRPTTALTTPGIDTTPPWQQRACSFLLRLLEQLGSHPTVWDPWLLLTRHRAVTPSVAAGGHHRGRAKP
jgi:hypothetical protein